jgi:ubiquinone/menaquinone biosynthesis C-methylase UbiE
MADKKSVSEKESSFGDDYFGLQATWGITKHLGGREATEELAGLLHIGKDSRVLIVGCGVGATACYLVKKHGCRVEGIDISEGMVARAKQRAEKEGVSEYAGFRVADAQELPFEDNSFDAVFSESVLAFVPDRQKAVKEFARVTAPGGCAGYNEVTWLEEPPADLKNYLTRIMGADFLAAGEWQALLENAGLKEPALKTYKTNVWQQWASEVRQFESLDFFKAWGKYFAMLFTSPATRRFTREAMAFPRSMFRLFRYFGYGIYTGRKQ